MNDRGPAGSMSAMVQENRLVGDYIGFSGQIVFPRASEGIRLRGVSIATREAAREGCYALQQLNPNGGGAVLPSPAENEHVLLSGVLAEPATAELAVRIREALVNQRYEDLARVAGNLSGCLVTPEKIYLWKSITGDSSTVFFRCSGDTIRWSTNPADLCEDPEADIDPEAIWRSCRTEDPFIYRAMDRVLPGQVVVLGRYRTTTTQFDRITPLDLPRRTTLPEYAELAYELLLDAVRPYAGSGRIGVLLSGGLDSSAVVAALVDVGADVIAYHLDSEDPLATEAGYARAVCEHLDVPLVSILRDNGPGYISRSWEFPHPYNHVGYRHAEQAAERAAEDGVTFLATGRDGDLLFGPMISYGVHDILFGDVRWREKREMLSGVLSSPWQMRHILKSCVTNYSLLTEATPIGDNAPRSDFLTPMLGVNHSVLDFEFLPQEHTMDLTLFRPRGILLCSPLGSKDLRRLALRLPNAYKRIPYQGRMIDKPVLRMMLASKLPESVWRRPGSTWSQSPHEHYSLRHAQALRDLIGSPDSHVVRTGMVNPALLAHVFRDPLSLRRNSESLVCSAMVELFLRSTEKRHGMAWKGFNNAFAQAS